MGRSVDVFLFFFWNQAEYQLMTAGPIQAAVLDYGIGKVIGKGFVIYLCIY